MRSYPPCWILNAWLDRLGRGGGIQEFPGRGTLDMLRTDFTWKGRELKMTLFSPRKKGKREIGHEEVMLVIKDSGVQWKK